MERSVYVIEPPRGWVRIGFGELWSFRELLYFLVWRDIKVRYKQTILGASWAVLQPLLAMVVFSLFFGRLAKMPSDGIPYPIFSYTALVPWTFFANGLNNSSNSLVTNANLLKKVYFPRLALPISAVLGGAVDFLLAFLVLLGMMAYYGVAPTRAAFFLPLFFLLAFTASLGSGLWLAAMNAHFRDVRYTLPFLTQLWLFATPIVYPSSLVAERFRPLLGLNPMAGVVEGFRWALLEGRTAPTAITLVSASVSVLLLCSGLAYFRRMENTLADTI